MKRVNTFKNEEPIRTPIVRLQTNSSSAFVKTFDKSNLTQKTPQLPQLSHSLDIKNDGEEDVEIKGNKLSQMDSKYLSIPRVRLQTPPVQCVRSRSQSVPSFENNIVMEFCSVKTINNKVNEDLIRFSSRHLSYGSPSKQSYSPTLLRNKFYEPKNLIVVNNSEKGHHSERESTNTSVSGSLRSLNRNNRLSLEKSKWLWSTIEDPSKLDTNQVQNKQIKSYCQRPPTPFETKGFRKSSHLNLKEMSDDIEEIQMNTEKNRNIQIEKAVRNDNSYLKFSKSFPFIRKHENITKKDEKSNVINNSAETVDFLSSTDSNDIFSK